MRIAALICVLLAFPAAAGGRIHGIAPIRGHRAPPASDRLLLSYHGGPVMHASTTYVIHWIPAGFRVAAGYRAAIATYLRDVAADSGRVTNVYSTLTQYGDTTGKAAYNVRAGGSTTDTTAFPASACHSPAGLRACLTDLQLRAEVTRVRLAHGWPSGTRTLYLLFLPRGVGACDTTAGGSCAFSGFCAYHGSTGSGPTLTLYAVMPYAETQPSACGVQQHPVGRDADATINVLSHEHREAITDPLGNAWYDADGYESSDRCAWNFGPAVGGPAGRRYTNLIHGHGYWIQQEWSNAGRACVQRGLRPR
jgi:hypothetical protein